MKHRTWRRRDTGRVVLGVAYQRAKRSVNRMPLKVGSKVLYEDERGRIHTRVFEIVTMKPGGLAVIKGWPNGIVRKGPMRRIVVGRSALVDARRVRDEAFKVMFDIPEDTKRVRYEYTLIGVRPRLRGAKRGRRG